MQAVTDSLRLLFTRWSRRASYPLFAWLCIVGLPVMLNILAGVNDDFRSSLGEYYGPISLFLMFQFSLGFTTFFLCTMLVTSVGRSGLIEELRLSRLGPRDLLHSLLRLMLQLLWPPALCFLLIIVAYMLYRSNGTVLLRQLYLDRAVLFIGLLALAQLGTILTIMLGLGRNVFWYVLLALPVQFMLTVGGLFLLISRVLAWEMMLLISLAVVWSLYWLGIYRLGRLWQSDFRGKQAG